MLTGWFCFICDTCSSHKAWGGTAACLPIRRLPYVHMLNCPWERSWMLSCPWCIFQSVRVCARLYDKRMYECVYVVGWVRLVVEVQIQYKPAFLQTHSSFWDDGWSFWRWAMVHLLELQTPVDRCCWSEATFPSFGLSGADSEWVWAGFMTQDTSTLLWKYSREISEFKTHLCLTGHVGGWEWTAYICLAIYFCSYVILIGKAKMQSLECQHCMCTGFCGQ